MLRVYRSTVVRRSLVEKLTQNAKPVSLKKLFRNMKMPCSILLTFHKNKRIQKSKQKKSNIFKRIKSHITPVCYTCIDNLPIFFTNNFCKEP